MGSSSERKGNHILAALEDDIDYCLDILKINRHDDDEIETKIKKLYAQNIAFFSTYHKRLITLKIIADVIILDMSNPAILLLTAQIFLKGRNHILLD